MRARVSRIVKMRSFAAVLALVGTSTFSTTAPAACASWGCGVADWLEQTAIARRMYGISEDTHTDGYCVYQRIRTFGDNWPGATIAGSKSCGPQAAYMRWYNLPMGVRLYREDGRYLTLWGN